MLACQGLANGYGWVADFFGDSTSFPLLLVPVPPPQFPTGVETLRQKESSPRVEVSEVGRSLTWLFQPGALPGVKCFITRGGTGGEEGRATAGGQGMADGPGQRLGWREVSGFERIAGGRIKETH